MDTSTDDDSWLCPFVNCNIRFNCEGNFHKHLSHYHLPRGVNCLGCSKAFSSVYKRNSHHHRCKFFDTYLDHMVQQQAMITSIQQGNTPNATSMPMPVHQQPFLPYPSAQPLVINHHHYNYSVVDNSNNSRNNVINQNNGTVNNYNLEPVNIDKMVECLANIVAETENTFTHINTDAAGHKLASNFPNNFVCTDKSRRTTRWLHPETGELIVDNRCAKFDKLLYSKSQPVVEVIDQMIARGIETLSAASFEYLLFLKKFKWRLVSNHELHKKTIGLGIANHASKHSYKRSITKTLTLKDEVSVNDKFSSLMKFIVERIESSISLDSSIILHTPEFFGGQLKRIITEYTSLHKLSEVKYTVENDYNDCTLMLADDDKKIQTLMVRQFMSVLRPYLGSMKAMFEDIHSVMVKGKEFLPFYIQDLDTNYNRLIAFIDDVDGSTTYEEAMFGAMASA